MKRHESSEYGDFQAEYEGSFLFTRSNHYNYLEVFSERLKRHP
jgi:hypothetical protein